MYDAEKSRSWMWAVSVLVRLRTALAADCSGTMISCLRASFASIALHL
jgi:hypothetical protein